MFQINIYKMDIDLRILAPIKMVSQVQKCMF